MDNDGDLDIITNNINENVFLYENLTQNAQKSVQISLKGSQGNLNAIGAKCFVYGDSVGVQYQEKFPVRVFRAVSKYLCCLDWAIRVASIRW
ncbi:MAG: hypothetical protein R2822_06130 [Spirosomataceae bacterium]